jgi:hypothetical protein
MNHPVAAHSVISHAVGLIIQCAGRLISSHVALCARETGIWRAETEAPKPAHHIQLFKEQRAPSSRFHQGARNGRFRFAKFAFYRAFEPVSATLCLCFRETGF